MYIFIPWAYICLCVCVCVCDISSWPHIIYIANLISSFCLLGMVISSSELFCWFDALKRKLLRDLTLSLNIKSTTIYCYYVCFYVYYITRVFRFGLCMPSCPRALETHWSYWYLFYLNYCEFCGYQKWIFVIILPFHTLIYNNPKG